MPYQALLQWKFSLRFRNEYFLESQKMGFETLEKKEESQLQVSKHRSNSELGKTQSSAIAGRLR